MVAGDLNAIPDSDEIRSVTGRRPPPVEGLIFSDAWELAGDGSPGHTWSKANEYIADRVSLSR